MKMNPSDVNATKANMLAETRKFSWPLRDFEGICEPVHPNDFNGSHETYFVIGRDLGMPTKFKIYLQTQRIESRPFLRLGVFLKLVEKYPGANEVRVDFRILFPTPTCQGEIVGDFLNLSENYPNNRGEGGILIDEGDDYGELPIRLDEAGDVKLKVEITLYVPKSGNPWN